MCSGDVPLAVQDSGPRAPRFGRVEQSPLAGMVVAQRQQVPADAGIVDGVDTVAIRRIREDRAAARHIRSPHRPAGIGPFKEFPSGAIANPSTACRTEI